MVPTPCSSIRSVILVHIVASSVEMVASVTEQVGNDKSLKWRALGTTLIGIKAWTELEPLSLSVVSPTLESSRRRPWKPRPIGGSIKAEQVAARRQSLWWRVAIIVLWRAASTVISIKLYCNQIVVEDLEDSVCFYAGDGTATRINNKSVWSRDDLSCFTCHVCHWLKRKRHW
jgi:hypothetical protein